MSTRQTTAPGPPRRRADAERSIARNPRRRRRRAGDRPRGQHGRDRSPRGRRARHDLRVIERGQAVGTFRANVPVAWHLSMLMALMHAASGQLGAGHVTEADVEPALVATTPRRSDRSTRKALIRAPRRRSTARQPRTPDQFLQRWPATA
jgi:hypothetical protein